MDGTDPAPLYRRLVVVPSYLILMGLAAIFSVLASVVLFAVAIAALLPIPRIDLAVHWVVVNSRRCSAILSAGALPGGVRGHAQPGCPRP